MNAGLAQRQSQAAVLAPQLQQGVKMLAMSLPELRSELIAEMAKNPVIDDVEPTLERTTISEKEKESAAAERIDDYPDDDYEPLDTARPDAEALECIIAELQGVYSLRMHLASLMVLSRNHREDAIRLLKKIVAENPHGDNEPQALLLLAECTAQGHAPSALRDAIALHERAAAHADKATAQHARIRRASYLVRLGDLQQAADDMRRILNGESPAPREDALARMVLANALSTGDDAARAEARSCVQELVDDKLSELPRDWQFMVLLAHGMRCSRMGEAQPALEAFQSIIAMNPALHTRNSEDEEWIFLYRAATGAISLMLENGEYTEALELADRVGGWNVSHVAPKWPRSFQKRAAEIRQEHIHASRPRRNN